MTGNIFDNFETPIEEVEKELDREERCQHLGLITTKLVEAPGPTQHKHMASVCEDCHEPLSYLGTMCHLCGPLP